MTALLISMAFLIPSVSSAASLTQPQVDAIISVLVAFDVDLPTIEAVKAALAPVAPETSITEAKSPIVVQTPLTQAPRVNMREILNVWRRFFPSDNELGFAIKGEINAWTDLLVRQGGVNIPYASQIEYFVDGASVGHPDQIGFGDFRMRLDTTKLANGRHELKIVATNDVGTDMQTTPFEVKN